MSRPTKRALAERQLSAAPAAQDLLERLLQPEDIVCPECDHVIERAKISDLNYKAATQIIASVGLGAMQRTKDESDNHGDMKEAMAEIADALRSLPEAERRETLRFLVQTVEQPLIELRQP